jgi:WD40 repeat protein
MDSMEPLINPYVGPRAFDASEERFFVGRDQEIKILEAQVMTRRVSLFFAQSGAGKSSLLHAGLVPALTRRVTVGRGRQLRSSQKMNVLPIVTAGGALGRGAQTMTNQFVFNALTRLLPTTPLAALANTSLVEALAPLLSPAPGAQEGLEQTLSTLLIFDQFEELFTYYPERRQEREAFFRQVSAAIDAYATLHVLLTMREDYIAELTPYAALLQDQLRPRFRLERLNRTAALQAITEPAARAGRSFAPGVAEALVDNLRRLQVTRSHVTLPMAAPTAGATTAVGEPVVAPLVFGEEVEPVHLQIVCRELWVRLPATTTTIQSSDVQSFGDVDEALIRFYESILQRVTHATAIPERQLRLWFAERLITPARTRGLVYRGETTSEGLDNAAVAILDREWLIRADLRGGDVWYELAHDRLIEPILASNAAWRLRYLQQNPLVLPTEAWLSAGRSREKLLRGNTLAEAQGFALDHRAELTELELELLENSLQQQQVEAAEARRAARVRRNIILAVALVLVALTALTLVAWRQARFAQSRALAAQAINTLDVDPEQSIALALQALETFYTHEAEEALHRAVQSSRVEQYLVGHTSAVEDVAFSPDGRHLATGSVDGTSRIWAANDGQLLHTLGPGLGIVYSVAFHPDGKQLATGSEDARVRLWQVESGDLLWESAAGGHRLSVMGVAFHPDGAQLASASKDRTVKLWQTATGAELATYDQLHTDEVRALAFNADGELLATASRDGTAKVIELASGEVVNEFVHPPALNGDPLMLNGVAFSPDQGRLVTAAWDGQIYVWDFESGEQTASFFGHTNIVFDVIFAGDGRLASSSWDRTVKLWEFDTGRERLTLAGHRGYVRGLAFRSDSQQLATASQDMTARIWYTGPARELYTLGEGKGGVNSLAYSPDGKLLAAGSSDGHSYLYDARTFQLRLTVPQTSSEQTMAQANSVNDVAFHPDGRSFATAGKDRSVVLWDVTSGAELAVLMDDENPMEFKAVSFSPDGKRLATAHSDRTAALWEIERQRLLFRLPAQAGEVNEIAFSPNGKEIAICHDGGDHSVTLWDAATGDFRKKLDGHTQDVYHVSYDPTGWRLVSAGRDQRVIVWNVYTGQPLLVLQGHADAVESVAFSPDGRRLATASWDRTARIWDASTGELIFTLRGHDSLLNDVAFTPDGAGLATAGDDGHIWTYLLDLEQLKTFARSRIRRSSALQALQ